MSNATRVGYEDVDWLTVRSEREMHQGLARTIGNSTGDEGGHMKEQGLIVFNLCRRFMLAAGLSIVRQPPQRRQREVKI